MVAVAVAVEVEENNNFGGNNNNQNNVNFEDQNLRTLHNSKRFILQDFVRDNTFVYAGGLTLHGRHEDPLSPNNRLPELADANTINTAIMGSMPLAIPETLKLWKWVTSNPDHIRNQQPRV